MVSPSKEDVSNEINNLVTKYSEYYMRNGSSVGRIATGRTKEGEREGAVGEGEGGVGGKKEERGEVHASSARGRPSSPIPGPLWGVNHRGWKEPAPRIHRFSEPSAGAPGRRTAFYFATFRAVASRRWPTLCPSRFLLQPLFLNKERQREKESSFILFRKVGINLNLP